MFSTPCSNVIVLATLVPAAIARPVLETRGKPGLGCWSNSCITTEVFLRSKAKKLTPEDLQMSAFQQRVSRTSWHSWHSSVPTVAQIDAAVSSMTAHLIQVPCGVWSREKLVYADECNCCPPSPALFLIPTAMRKHPPNVSSGCYFFLKI